MRLCGAWLAVGARWRAIVAGAVLLVVLATTVNGRAEATQDNLDKYNGLRDRLRSEFLVVGQAPGQSQPADVRSELQSFMKWADGTIRMGWYIGVLATEHYLYAHPELFPGAAMGGSSATLDELYDALSALERLDEVADASFPPPCTSAPLLNGFFLRDDVPAGFHQNFPPIATTFSDFVDPVITNKEMSQDQVYHVLFGLALVKRFVEPEARVAGRELRAWAIEQARRIIEHVSKDQWVIKNPACGDRDVNRGPLATAYSPGTQKAIGFITDGAYLPAINDVLIGVWAQAHDPIFVGYLDIDNLHMAMAIAAVGNGWDATTADDLAALAEEPDWPLYPLLHRALHGDAAAGWCNTGQSINARARAMLDELPMGAEPASPQPNGPAVHGFTRSSRFLRGRETAYSGEEGSEGYRFNGLDYMLLHNLYALATPATWDYGGGPGIPECPEPAVEPPPPGEEDDSGCACRTAPAPSHGSWTAVALLALVGAHRRRRRARR